MLSERQRLVFVKVCLADINGKRYRAESSGERVTLASLYRTRRLLDRWAWRGVEGDADAAYEYALHPKAREELRGMFGIQASPWIVVGAKVRTARAALGPGQRPKEYEIVQLGTPDSLIKGPEGIERCPTTGIALVLEPMDTKGTP